jgi:hypothetical protein
LPLPEAGLKYIFFAHLKLKRNYYFTYLSGITFKVYTTTIPFVLACFYVVYKNRNPISYYSNCLPFLHHYFFVYSTYNMKMWWYFIFLCGEWIQLKAGWWWSRIYFILFYFILLDYLWNECLVWHDIIKLWKISLRRCMKYVWDSDD